MYMCVSMHTEECFLYTYSYTCRSVGVCKYKDISIYLSIYIYVCD